MDEYYDIEELKEKVKNGIYMFVDNYTNGIIFTPFDHIAYGILKRKVEKYKRLRKMNHERIKKKRKI